MLPRVAELEERFAGPLVVVGVHSGKFTEERRTPNIREACARLDVHHPVVNDRQYRIWRAYGVRAWPSVALIAPDGTLVGVQAGEFQADEMAGTIAGLAETWSGKELLRTDPIDFGEDPFPVTEPAGELRYPTRMVAEDETLYISDTGHHRVLEVVLEEDGGASLRRVFGSGKPGFRDGPAESAEFAEPQGLALSGRTLLAADRRNHVVRAIDLDGGAVRTIAGTGGLGEWEQVEGPGRETALRSPWGLAIDGDTLYVTMAGSHQIVQIDLASEAHEVRIFAGNGAEDVRDGRREKASLAQPTGVALGAAAAPGSAGPAAASEEPGVTARRALFFADSETSSVRWADTGPRGDVGTIVGTGLFEFGNRDGIGTEVRLQHDLDLAVVGGDLFVADTYNNRIKRISVETGACETMAGPAGSGEALYEPSGVWAGPRGVIVADTNHHRLVRLDPATGELTSIEVRALTHATG